MYRLHPMRLPVKATRRRRKLYHEVETASARLPLDDIEVDGGEAPDPTGVSQVVDTPPEQDAAESTQMTGEEIEDDRKDRDVPTLAKCLPPPPPLIAAPTAEECSSATTMPDSSFCSPEKARFGSISPSGGLLSPSASGWHIAGKRSSAATSATAATKRARMDSGGICML